MKLTVYSSDGTTSSEKDFANIPTFEGDKGLQAVKEVIVAINANNRQGTHSTKTRGEVRGGGKKPYSRRLQATMDREARLLIAEAYRRTESVLTEYKDQLGILAEALLERETLNYADVEKLLGPPKYGKKQLVSPADFERQLKEQAELGKTTTGI